MDVFCGRGVGGRGRCAVAVLAAALACGRAAGPGPPESPRQVAEPVGVDATLLTRAELAPGDPEEKCRGAMQLARCLQARAHPEVRFTWTLVWHEYGADGVAYSEAQLRASRQEILDRLSADGAREIYVPQASLWHITVVAPHPAVRGAMASPHVRMVEVGCADDEQEFCACGRLRVEQCGAHAFCQSLHARRMDASARCYEPAALAGCTRAEGCNDTFTYGVDPRGALWEFRSGCRPDQPGWRGLAMVERGDRLAPPCEGDGL